MDDNYHSTASLGREKGISMVVIGVTRISRRRLAQKEFNVKHRCYIWYL